MFLALTLFENDLSRIVSITFTALILNELLLVAVKINNWHIYMVYAQLISLGIYLISISLLTKVFDAKFVYTFNFVFKVGIITLFSSFPFFLIKVIRHRVKPANYTKLES